MEKGRSYGISEEGDGESSASEDEESSLSDVACTSAEDPPAEAAGDAEDEPEDETEPSAEALLPVAEEEAAAPEVPQPAMSTCGSVSFAPQEVPTGS